MTLLKQPRKAGASIVSAFLYVAAYFSSIQASGKMFEFELLSKRDWVLVAVFVMLAALVIGFGVYWLIN